MTEEKNNKYISLTEAAEGTDYSQEYLSLRARQGKLKAVKFGRNWVTKKEWIDEYITNVNDNGVSDKVDKEPKQIKEKKKSKEEFWSLLQAEEYSGYSQEYLSLRARQGKLRATKLGRNWVTKKEWIDEYKLTVNNHQKNIVAVEKEPLGEKLARAKTSGVRLLNTVKQKISLPSIKLPSIRIPSVQLKGKFSFPANLTSKIFTKRFAAVTLSAVLMFTIIGTAFGYPLLQPVRNFVSEITKDVRIAVSDISHNIKDGSFLVVKEVSDIVEYGSENIIGLATGIIQDVKEETSAVVDYLSLEVKIFPARISEGALGISKELDSVFVEIGESVIQKVVLSYSVAGSSLTLYKNLLASLPEPFIRRGINIFSEYRDNINSNIASAGNYLTLYREGVGLQLMAIIRGIEKSEDEFEFFVKDSIKFVSNTKQKFVAGTLSEVEDAKEKITQGAIEVAQGFSLGVTKGTINILAVVADTSKVTAENIVSGIKKGIKGTAKGLVMAVGKTTSKAKYISHYVYDDVSNDLSSAWKFITKPWRKFDKDTVVTMVDAGVATTTQEDTIKEIIKEVHITTEIRPVKEIIKEIQVTKVDEAQLVLLKNRMGDIEKLIDDVKSITLKLKNAPPNTQVATAPIYITSPGIYSQGPGIFSGVGGEYGSFINISAGRSLTVSNENERNDFLTVWAPSTFYDNMIISDSILTVGSATEFLFIDATGNLNTTGNIVANGTLSMRGNVFITNGTMTISSTSTPQLTVAYSTSTELQLTVVVDLNGNLLLTSSGNYIERFATTSAYALYQGYNIRFAIDTAGNVGVGTTTPEAVFTVYNYDPTKSNNLFRISSSSLEALLIDKDGNLGIGTVTPQEKLVLEPGANFVTEMAFPASVTVATSGVGTLSADTYYFKIVALDGVGTTIASTEASTTVALNEEVNLAWDTIQGAASYRVYFATTSDGQARYFATTSAYYSFSDASGGSLGTVPVVTTAYVNRLASGGNSWMLGGNVGIGTTTPIVSLVIAGTDAVMLPYGTDAQRPTSRTGMIRFNTTATIFEGYDGNNWAGLGGVIDVDRDTYIIAESVSGADEDVLFFYTSSTENMRLDNSGKLGIGTTSPTALLSVYGTTTTGGDLFRIGTTTQDYLLVDGSGNLTVYVGTTTLATTTVTSLEVASLVHLRDTLFVDATTTLATATIASLEVASLVHLRDTLFVDATTTLATTTMTQAEINQLIVVGDFSALNSTSTNLDVLTQLHSLGTLIVDGLSNLSTTTLTLLTSENILNNNGTSTNWDVSTELHSLGTLIVDGLSTLATLTATNATTTNLDILTQLHSLGTLIVDGASTLGDTLDVTATTTLSSNLIVDTDTFYVDSYRNRVGIGTTSPTALLSVYGTTTTGGDLFRIGTTTQDYLLVDGSGNLTVYVGTTTLATTTVTSLEVASLVHLRDTLFVDATSTMATATIASLEVLSLVHLRDTLFVDATTTLSSNLIVDTDTFYVDSYRNRVGIGTAGPQQRLTLSSGSNYATEMAFPTSVTAATSTGGSLVAYTYYFEIVALDGVGTTIGSAYGSTEASTTAVLNEEVNLAWDTIQGAVSYRVYFATTSGAQARYFATTSVFYSFADSSGGTVGTVPTVTTAYVNKLTASGSSWLLGGNVGIGTTTPDAKLTVVGAISGTGTLTIDGAAILGSTFSVTATTTLATTTLTSLEAASLVHFKDTLFVDATTTMATATIASLEVLSLVHLRDTLFVDATTTLTLDLIVDGSTFYVDTYRNRVGIGTTTPIYKFETVGTSTAGFFAVSQNSAGDLFVIDNNGDIGISSSTPATLFVVMGTSTMQNIIPAADNTYYLGSAGKRWANAYFATTTIGGTIIIDSNNIIGSGQTDIIAGAASTWETTAGDLTLQSAKTLFASSSEEIIFVASGVERMRISSSTGYIGINTTGPDRKLDVLDASNPQLRLTYADGSVYVDMQGTSAGHLSISGSGGNVGIGTSTPDIALVVVGSSNITATSTANEFVGNGELLTLARIGNSTFSTLQDLQNIFHSTGWVTGGAISDNGNQTFAVTAGTGLIRISNSRTAELQYFDWSASSTVAIADDEIIYIGIDLSGGSPVIVQKTTDTWDYTTAFPLGTGVRESTDLHFINNPQAIGDHASFMVQRVYTTVPLARDNRNGGIILGETGTTEITVTSGTLWDRLNDFVISAIDTSGTDSFTTYTRDGGGGFNQASSTQVHWPNAQYDDNSGSPVDMVANRYSVLWFYIEADSDLVMLYGQSQFSNLASAEADTPPSALPKRLNAHGRLIGKLIFQKDDTTAQTIESVFTTTFQSTLASDHGGLAGLTDDDHTQYLLADGSRALAGAWSMGSQVLTNVNIDSGNLTVTEATTTNLLSSGYALFNTINVDATSTMATATIASLEVASLVHFKDTLFVDATSTMATATIASLEVLSLAHFRDTVFIDATTTLTLDLIVDGSTFYVDTYRNRVGIGTSTPTYKFETVGTSTAGFFAVSQNSAGDLFVIDNNGDIGISSSTPATLFVVMGTSTMQNIIPAADNTYYLGSAGKRWANAYFATTTIGGTITIDSNNIIGSGQTDIIAGAASTWETTAGDLTIQSAKTLFASSSEEIIFVASGVERMRISSSTGYIGINTTGPQQRLTLSSGSNYATEMAFPTSVTAATTTGGSLVAYTYYFQIVALDGVGTTIGSTEASTTAALNETITVSWTAPTGAASFRVYYGTTSDAQARYFTDTASPYSFTTSADGTVGTVPSVTTAYINKFTASGNSWFLGGNVGIGTTTPIYKLEIVGTSTAGFFGVSQNSAGDLFVVDNSGNVGIGVAAPQGLLDVTKTTNQENLYGIRSWLTQSGTNTNTFAGYYRVDTDAAVITLTNAYGLFLADGTKGAGSTIDNNYGLYIENIAKGTNNYAIYSTGGTNYFGGNIGIGTTSPTALLTAYSDATGLKDMFTIASTTDTYFKVTDTGFVGIGTTSPDALLHVSGGSILLDNAQQLKWVRDNGLIFTALQVYSDDYTYLDGPAGIYLRTNGKQRMTVDINGNVGIGTTSPTALLTAYSDATALKDMFTIASTSATYFKVTDTGNVGIGTDSPSHRLTIGSIENSTPYGEDGIGIKTDSDGVAIFIEEMTGGSESWGIGVDADGDLNFFDSGIANIRMTLQDGGNIGINTSGPDRKLDVLDDTNPQLRLTYTDGSVYTDLQTTSTGNLYINPSGGKVGIGTDSPDGLLHLYKSTGQVIPIIESDDDNAKLRLDAGATDKYSAIDFFMAGTGYWEIGADGGISQNFYIFSDQKTGGGARVFSIDKEGNVGIGTTTPGSKLVLRVASGDNVGGILISQEDQDEEALTIRSISTSSAIINIDVNDNGRASSTAIVLDIDTYTGFIGTFIDIDNGSNNIYTLNTVQALYDVPVSFNAPGDVSLAYDLVLTNLSTAYITFDGPGHIRTNSAFGNNDLTLSAANDGAVIVQDIFEIGTSTTALFYVDPRVNKAGFGTSTPGSRLVIRVASGDNMGGLLITQEDQDEEALTIKSISTSSAIINIDVNDNGRASSTAIVLDIDTYTGFIGTFIDIDNGSNNIYTLNTVQALYDVPVSFNAPGDVSLAYDLVLTNTNAAYITFNGPGYIRTSDPSGNFDLTLSAANSGDVVINDDLEIIGETVWTATTTQVIATTSDINVGSATHIVIVGAGGGVKVESTPTIADGITGQVIIIRSASSTDSVTIQDQNILTSSNLELGANERELTNGDSISLMFDGSDWIELWFSGGVNKADYAEMYKVVENVEVNEVVAFVEGHLKVGKAKLGDKGIAGIISASPAYLIGQGHSDEMQLPVALAGRIPVKISLEAGPIEKGDLLVPSTVPGEAMKFNQEYILTINDLSKSESLGTSTSLNIDISIVPIIGIALEAYDGTTKEPEFIETIYQTLEIVFASGVTIPEINMFNARYKVKAEKELLTKGKEIEEKDSLEFIGSLIIELRQEYVEEYTQDELVASYEVIEERVDIKSNPVYAAEMNNRVMTMVKTGYINVIAAANATRLTLKAEGDKIIMQSTLVVDRIETGQLEIGSTEKPTGITLYDEETGDAYCIKMKAGAMVSLAGKCTGRSPTPSSGAEPEPSPLSPLLDTISPTSSSPSLIEPELGSASTTITSYPEVETESVVAVFTFVSPQENVTFQCKIDDGEFADCSSPRSYSNLTREQHMFNIRSVTQEGIEEEIPAGFVWTIIEPFVEEPEPVSTTTEPIVEPPIEEEPATTTDEIATTTEDVATTTEDVATSTEPVIEPEPEPETSTSTDSEIPTEPEPETSTSTDSEIPTEPEPEISTSTNIDISSPEPSSE